MLYRIPSGWIVRPPGQIHRHPQPLGRAVNSTANLFQKPDEGLNAKLKILQVEFLIWRVKIIVGQAKTHHHAGKIQMTGKVANNWNRATRADKYRIASPDFLQGPRCRLDVRIVDWNQAWIAGMNQSDINVNASGGDLLNEALI